MIDPVSSDTTVHNSPRRRSLRYWALGAAAILVALGTATLVALQAPQPPGPSRSALALRAAHDDAVHLAGLAHAAAGRDGATPADRAALSTAGTVLDREANVLADDSPRATPGPASATAPAAPEPERAGSTSAMPVTPQDVAAALAASVHARLSALPDVDAPTATLLASLAAGQSVQLDAISAAEGSSPAPTPTASPTATASPSPSSSASPCPKPTATASPGATNFPGALASAARAESAAAYLLETALARTPAGSAAAAARSSALDAHRHQLSAVEGLAAAACVALPPRDPGFAVPPGFTTDPAAALAAVEGSSTEAWAQLVGSAPGQRRQDVAAGLITAARLAAAAAPATVTAFPGVPTAQ